MPTLAALAVVLVAASLGHWQLRRADEKRALQAQLDAAAVSAPIAIPAQRADPESLDGRRVSVRGRWIAERTVFVDNRTYKGVAGFHVVTPVRIEHSGLHLLVLRGWVARDPRDRLRLPAVPTPEGAVEIVGVAQATLPRVLELKAAPPPGPQDRIWQNLDLERFERWSGLALQPLVLRQSPEAQGDGLVRDWAVAGAMVDKHIGYAVQWFALAAAAAGLWLYYILIGRRRDHDTDA